MFYIDLDMIVTGNIDNLLEYKGIFGTLKTDDFACEKNNKGGYNSSVMIWRSNDDLRSVFSELDKNYIDQVMDKYSSPNNSNGHNIMILIGGRMIKEAYDCILINLILNIQI